MENLIFPKFKLRDCLTDSCDRSIILNWIRGFGLQSIGVIVTFSAILFAIENRVANGAWNINIWLIAFVIAIGISIGLLPRIFASVTLEDFSAVDKLEEEFGTENQQNDKWLTVSTRVIQFLSEATQFYIGPLSKRAKQSGFEDDLTKQLLDRSASMVQNLEKVSASNQRILNSKSEMKRLLELVKSVHSRTGLDTENLKQVRADLSLAQQNVDTPPGFGRILAEVKKTLDEADTKDKSEFAEEIYVQSSILYLDALIIVVFSPAAWNRIHEKTLDLFDRIIAKLESIGEHSERAQRRRIVLIASTKNIKLSLQPA